MYELEGKMEREEKKGRERQKPQSHYCITHFIYYAHMSITLSSLLLLMSEPPIE